MFKGVRYFSKVIFPRATSQVTISQVATCQMCNFPSNISFPKVRLGPLRSHRLQWGNRPLRIRMDKGPERRGQNRSRPSTATRTDSGSCRLEKLHIWEVATWEKSFGKIPNISPNICSCSLQRIKRLRAMNKIKVMPTLYFFFQKVDKM